MHHFILLWLLVGLVVSALSFASSTVAYIRRENIIRKPLESKYIPITLIMYLIEITGIVYTMKIVYGR